MPHQARSDRRNEPLPDIIDECYERFVALLKKNAHHGGVIAAARTRKAADRNYASIFGRDAAICSLGMVVSGDRELIQLASEKPPDPGKIPGRERKEPETRIA